MAKRKRISAGLLLYRLKDSRLECFIAHPGGPFWKNRHKGAWTIPKGIVEEDEDHLQAAIREFTEETGVTPHGPYQSLGSVRLKSGKIIHAWAWRGDADADSVCSNTATMEWPRGSGKTITYPEIDRCGWYSPDEARRLMNPAQAELVDRLEELVDAEDPLPTSIQG